MNRIGLVIAGGGGKGAYFIGVWKAFKEFEIENMITDVSGTSVGALNAMLFAQGDFKRAEKIWLNLKAEDILKFDIEKVISNFLKGNVLKKLFNPLVGILTTIV